MECHFSVNWLAIEVNWVPQECHLSANWLPLECQWNANLKLSKEPSNILTRDCSGLYIGTTPSRIGHCLVPSEEREIQWSLVWCHIYSYRNNIYTPYLISHCSVFWTHTWETKSFQVDDVKYELNYTVIWCRWYNVICTSALANQTSNQPVASHSKKSMVHRSHKISHCWALQPHTCKTRIFQIDDVKYLIQMIITFDVICRSTEANPRSKLTCYKPVHEMCWSSSHNKLNTFASRSRHNWFKTTVLTSLAGVRWSRK